MWHFTPYFKNTKEKEKFNDNKISIQYKNKKSQYAMTL